MAYMTKGERRRYEARIRFEAERELAERNPCPACDAPAGETCTNPITGQRVRFTAHWQRFKEGTADGLRSHVDNHPPERTGT